MIELYTASVPNGWKASVTLEELGIDYKVHAVNLGDGDQKKPEFLKICPNGRIPAIVDRENNGDWIAVARYFAHGYTERNLGGETT